MEHASFFRYRTGNTWLHRMPPAAKIFLMLALAIASFYLPVPAAAIAWLFVLAAGRLFGFSAKDIFSDIQPALFYCFVLYLASLSQNALRWSQALEAGTVYPLSALFIPEPSHLALAAHLALSLSVSALFYRTTSNVQFHEGFAALERAITRKKSARYADSLSLTLTFIPQIVANWQQIDCAWKARGGKNGVRKIIALVPLLFSVSMKKAYDKALAIENRR